jgi:CHASE3 domain sensor protein
VEKITLLLEDIEKTLNGLVAILKLAEQQTWTPSSAQELKLVLILFTDLIVFGGTLFESGKLLVESQVDVAQSEKARRLMHRFRDVLQKCFSFIDHTVQVNHITSSGNVRRAELRGEFNLK